MEKIWAPYVANNTTSLLLLDEFKSYTQPVFGRQLSDLGTDLNIIPGGYTCVLQPCDVGVNKPIKEAVRAQYDDWAATQMATAPHDANVPVPKREIIVPWIAKAWEGISEQSIRNTFTSIGFGVERVVLLSIKHLTMPPLRSDRGASERSLSAVDPQRW